MILFGSPVVGITKIDYKQTQKKENLYGIGRDVVGRGYGNFEYSGSIELYIEEWKKIVQAAPNNSPLEIPYFTITISYGGAGVVPTQDILYNVEFLENPFMSNQGDTNIKVTVPILIGGLQRY
jgi:hypothetical protein